MRLDDVYSEWKYQTIDMLNSTTDTLYKSRIEGLTELGNAAFEKAFGMREELSDKSFELELDELRGQYYDLECLFLSEKVQRKNAEQEVVKLQKELVKNSDINLAHSIEVGMHAVSYLTHMDRIITNAHHLMNSDKNARSLISVIENLKTVDRLGRGVSKNWENTEIYKSLKLAIDDLLFGVSIISEMSKNVTDATSTLAMPLHPQLSNNQMQVAKGAIAKKLQESSLVNLNVNMEVITEPLPGTTTAAAG
jgi:hypothetical protein